MNNDHNNRTMILLLERGECGNEVAGWLSENGFITWKAYDVCHAIEELSDYTVRHRPDVVMLEVTSLPQRFDALRNVLSQSTGDDCVCGYSPEGRRTGRRFASDLDQLKSMINHRVRPSSDRPIAV